MRFQSLKKYGLTLLLLLYTVAAGNMLYAQNEARYYRFQYQKLQWKVYRSKQYNIYFPADAADSLYRHLVTEIPAAMAAIKKAMIKEVPANLNLVVYPSITKTYESNIGINESTKFPFPSFVNKGKRILIGFDGSFTNLRANLYEALARATWESQVKNAEKAPADKGKCEQDGDVPYWFSEGAVRFFAHGWRIDDEDNFRRSFQQNNFAGWQQVAYWQPRLAGQAFCYYMSQQYYPNSVAQTVFQLKKKKTLKRAVRLVAKHDLDSICSQCFRWYCNRFGIRGILADIDTPDFKLPIHKGIVQALTINPEKKLVAYTVLFDGIRSVYLYNLSTGRLKLITKYRLPPWLDEHSKDTYPLLQWHKDSKQLYVGMPVKGKIRIKRFDAEGVWQETTTLEGIDGISSFKPLSDRAFLLSAYREGQSDIITYDDNNGKVVAHTEDEYDDTDPILTGHGDQLIWIGNRPEKYTERRVYLIGVGYKKDTLLQGVFSKEQNIITPLLADTLQITNYRKPVWLHNGKLLLTSTSNGSEHFVTLDPYTKATKEYGTYERFEYLQSSDEAITWKTKTDTLYINCHPFIAWLESRSVNSDTTSWLRDYTKMKNAADKEDSLLNKAKDTAHYAMDDVCKPRQDTTLKKRNRGKSKIVTSDTEPYILQLHSAYFTAQVNNDYFINRYQPYAAYQGEFKFPELGGMTKGGFSDLLENHHFNIAYRLPAATEGSDINIRYENTERKADWGLSYFRKVETLKPDPKRNWVDENGQQYPSNAKIKTHYYEFFLRRPLTFYSAITLQLALRHDRTVFLATDKYTLDFPPLKAAWSINTLSYRINKLQPTLPGLFKGVKADAHIDGFKGFDKKEALVYGITANFTWHKPVYKYITLVLQSHFGLSGGDEKILYSLGGVDNNVTPQQDTSVHFVQTAPYAFQTLVTPYRGRLQRSAYGNRYALFNADIYFPVFKTLFPLETPLPFINNLQPGLLCDIAMAKETWKIAASTTTQVSFGFSLKSTLAGYPLRIDYAWPGTFGRKPVWYFSLSL